MVGQCNLLTIYSKTGVKCFLTFNITLLKAEFQQSELQVGKSEGPRTPTKNHAKGIVQLQVVIPEGGHRGGHRGGRAGCPGFLQSTRISHTELLAQDWEGTAASKSLCSRYQTEHLV